MKFFFTLFFLYALSYQSVCQYDTLVEVRHDVTLKQAHIGDLEIDSLLLISYLPVPIREQQFYLAAREIFTDSINTCFTDKRIQELAGESKLMVLGGPMLGNLSHDAVELWLRPAKRKTLRIKLEESGGGNKRSYSQKIVKPGEAQRVLMEGLIPGKRYSYKVMAGWKRIGEGTFKTAPLPDDRQTIRIAFGSCFHKIGLHNPNLIRQIVEREPLAMMLLGDIAADDREDNFNMHRSDYLLRDLSPSWKNLSANMPLYAAWDDHDYLNNDLSGIPEGFDEKDVDGLRMLWRENWINPQGPSEAIYFSTRLGPVELIMLDTRSCREVEQRGKYASYLGREQMEWLKNTLKKSDADFKIISSGTMWSDFISNGKDSWGTWDTIGRKEVFDLILAEDIEGVLFVSGDRHGARGFRFPHRGNGAFYEFQVASLGGVPGPDAMAKNSAVQLFGYEGIGLRAFGEFTFEYRGDEPLATFRLINERGEIMEEILIRNQ